MIGDFYVQTETVAKNKENSLKWMIYHCFCYWAMVMAVSLPVMSWQTAWFGTIASILHMVIDGVKSLKCKEKRSAYRI